VGDVQTDSVTMADAAAFTVGDVQTDSVTATDAAALNFGGVQTDSVTMADAINTFALNKALTDTATMADAINTFALNKALTDTATMADAINLILTLGQSSPLYDWAFTSDDKFTYFQVPGTINSHLIHQPLINGEFVLTTDPNAGIVYTIRTESYSYMFAGYGLKQEEEVKNLVVTVGKNFIASSMAKTTTNSPAAMTHMEVGTGTTAAAAGDTTLETAVASSRVTLTSTTVTTNNVAYVATFPAGTGTGALTEAGIFNASSSGTLLCRTVFSVINKGAADTLGITWTVTVN